MVDNHLRSWDRDDLAEVVKELLNIGVELLPDGDFRITIPPTQAGRGDVIRDRKGRRGVVESIHDLRLRFVMDDGRKCVAREGEYDVLRRIESEPYVPIQSIGSSRSEIVRQAIKRRMMRKNTTGHDSRVALQLEINELEHKLRVTEGRLG